MSTSGFSVSIPNSVRKTIQDIKDITVNQSEEEIYAMLKECSMDPNKTTQKLLLQDTFHDKWRRERRKKNLSNKQTGEVRWRSGTQGRGGRGGRVSLSPRFTSHDAGWGRGSGPGKENGLNQGAEKDVAPLQTSYESKNKERSSVTSSAPVIANGPTNMACGSTSTVHASSILAGSGGPEISLSYVGKDISSSKLNPGDANKNPIAVGTEDSWEQPAPSPTSSLAVCFSSSDPVLDPSNDSQVPAAVGLKREVGSRCLPATEIGSSSAQGMMPNSFRGVGKCQLTELSQAFSISTHGGSSVSLPSSNYRSWSQQIICGQNDETFPEVKRKRERRKKNLSNKQPGEVRWRSGMQGRGGRGGSVSFSPRFASHDAGGMRGSGSGKENGLNQGAEKDVAPLQTSYESKNKESSSVTSSAPVSANGPTNIACGSTSTVHASNILAGSGGPEISLSYAGKDISSSKLNPGDVNKNPIAVGTEDSWEQPAPSPTSSLAVCFSSSGPVLEPSNDSQVPAAVGLKHEIGSHCLPGSGGPEISLSYVGKDISSSKLNPGDANKNPIAVGTEDSWEQPAPSPTSSLAVCFSSSDPVLEPSKDSQVPAAVGLKREVGSHCLPAAEIGSSSAQGMMPNSFQGVGKCQLTELSHSFSISTHGGFSVSLPSSNCSSWSQQIICGQKDVGSDEEWKSKPTSSAVQGPGTAGASEIPTAAAEATTLSQPEAKLQRKLEELHLPQHQHVILPNHIHIPESERTKLSFGSFGASSVVTTGNASGEERDKCSTTVSETSQRIEDTMEEHSSRFVMYCILALGLVWIASFFA